MSILLLRSWTVQCVVPSNMGEIDPRGGPVGRTCGRSGRDHNGPDGTVDQR